MKYSTGKFFYSNKWMYQHFKDNAYSTFLVTTKKCINIVFSVIIVHGHIYYVVENTRK